MANISEEQVTSWLASIQFMQRFQKLFITGCPKSGTTWLVRALDGHPQIVANGEGRLAWRLFPYIELALNAFNKDHHAFAGTKHAQIHETEALLVFRSFSDNLLLRYLMTSGKPHENVRVVADKTPQHVMSVKTLRAIYPTCRFINIVRDPRDAATSAMFHLGKNDPDNQKFVESFITQSWRTHVEAAVSAEQQFGADVFLNIRYEDMHRDEANVLGRCLDFIGVESTDEMVQACSNAGSFEKLSGGRKRGQKDPNSFYRSGTTGDWKNHLDPALAARCCVTIEGLMKHFRYTNEPAIETKICVGNPGAIAA